MRLTRRLAALSLIALGIAACPPPDQQWDAGLDPDDRDALTRWLMCEDCPTLEARDAAAQLGDRAFRPIAAILSGPPEEWRTAMTARYGRLARRVGADSAQVVDHYLARFDATIQRRSVMLLGAIGGQGARDILRAALEDSAARAYSDDVIRTIQVTLTNLELTPFSGQLSDSVAGFLDTVVVRRGTGPVWDGDESVSLTGSPFPDDVTAWRAGDSLGFVAAGETGWYAVTLRGVGPANAAQRDSLYIQSFPGPPGTGATDILVDPLPRTILLALARSASFRDTARYYRFRSPVERTVRATVHWPGPSTIDMTWDDCTSRSFPGLAGRITGTVVNHQGNPIDVATVNLQGTGRSAATNDSGRFSMAGVTPGLTGTLRATYIGYAPTTIPAAEGRDHWIVMHPPASSPPIPPSQRFSGVSGHSATLVIPAGGCRLLGLIKTDSAAATVIGRVRVTQP